VSGCGSGVIDDNESNNGIITVVEEEAGLGEGVGGGRESWHGERISAAAPAEATPEQRSYCNKGTHQRAIQPDAHNTRY
jgi:hypothetical protein